MTTDAGGFDEVDYDAMARQAEEDARTEAMLDARLDEQNDAWQYELATQWLMSFADFERGSGPRRSQPDFALDRIRSLLLRLGDPQHGRITIHVAGSKGKGSTAAILESILRAAGFRTGLFTSPHLHTFSERIRIDGVPLSDSAFAAGCGQLRTVVEAELAETPGHVSTFEILTALSFHVFERQDVDVQIVEVGLGGRLDCTNVFARTDAAVITALSHEHTDILGDKITQIAAEKAGIITAACRNAVLSPQRFEDAAAVVRDAADDVPAPLVDVGADYEIEPAGVEEWGQWFRVHRQQPRPGEPAEAMHLLPLLGRHQLDNAVTAIATIDVLNADGVVSVPSEALQRGLATVEWPARLEYFELLYQTEPDGEPLVREDAPGVVIDGAHNADSVQRALNACRDYFPHQELHVVFGALGDKALADMARIIQTHSDHVYATSSDHPRARPAQSVVDAFTEGGGEWRGRISVHEDVHAAITTAASRAGHDDLILVLGSLSLAADARAVLTEPPGVPVDEGIEQDPAL